MRTTHTRKPIVFTPDEDFLRWFEAVEARHLADLTFSEVRRGVQALSTAYVERRDKPLDRVLTGAGKRAAFAMFYAPLHFLLLRAILRSVEAGTLPVDEILDLGCGTGVGAAAWALETEGTPRILGVERHSWATGEALWSWNRLGIEGRVLRKDLNAVRLPGSGAGIIVAFTANELDESARNRLKDNLFDAVERGARVLVVEPVARRISPWWDEWTSDALKLGGLVQDWRFRVDLPGRLRLMDRAAGLDHQLLTARSLWFPGRIR